MRIIDTLIIVATLSLALSENIDVSITSNQILFIQEPSTMNQYILGTFNIANARGDEFTPKFRFGVRLDAVCHEINKSKFDVLAIQEIRPCLNQQGTKLMTPMEIASYIAYNTNMTIASFERVGVTDLAFWRLTLYNSSRLYHFGSKLHWINYEKNDSFPGTPHNWGNLVVESRFCPLTPIEISNKPNTPVPSLTYIPDKSFTFYNSHFPLNREQRMATSEWIADRKLHDTCYFVVGDMNTFEDDGGDAMMKTMLVNNTRELLPEKTKTFRSFPHDKFQGASLLDHMLGNGDFVLKSSKVYDSSDYELRPSDHFMCEVVVEL